MHFLLLSLFALASCAVASPTCSDEEANKCGKGLTIKENYPENAKDLDELCPIVLSELSCQIDFSERCPNTLLSALKKSIIEYKRLYENLCSDTDVRRIHLKVGGCLNKLTDDLLQHCEETVTTQDYCQKTEETIQCTRDGVVQKCGTDAGVLFDAQMKPKKEFTKVFCLKPE